MKKPKLLVPAMYAREMIDSPDLDRLLASGSYLVATRPKKLTANAIAQREFKRQRGEAGFKRLDVLLSEQVYSLLLSVLREGETQAELIERLLNLPDNNDSISLVQADK